MIRMNFYNPNANSASIPIQRPVPNTMSYSNTNMSLNSGMIGRIHKTKPGCSSCGKKVY